MTISGSGQSATQLRYAPCSDGAEVILWPLTRAGHVWPGGRQNRSPWARRLLGPPTTIVDANELMWQFFERHPLPAG